MALSLRSRAITRHLSSPSPSLSLSASPSSLLKPGLSSSYPLQTQSRCYTQNLTRPLQIYRSTSSDPYLNLSIEHHLLQNSHPDSTILFLYTNRPSIVIGRNQNPWLEVNLHALRQGLLSPPSPPSPPPTPSALPTSAASPPDGATDGPRKGNDSEQISLVRRRSGGGTVFHDAHNTNWSVICPPPAFDRDKHAEMVVRALKGLGVQGVRVNERHDIVMDVDPSSPSVSGGIGGGGGGGTFKISGSAYKLTRTRSLHHGTCLLASENLGRISKLLRSPAEGFIKARGVESVRSPVRNVGVGGEAFAEAVVSEFWRMYGDEAVREVVVGEEEALAVEGVVKGVRELASPDWIFGQTPQFVFSTYPTEDDPRERPDGITSSLPRDFRAHLTVRHGEIQAAHLAGLQYRDSIDEASQDEILANALVKQRLHHIRDWRQTLEQASPVPVDVDTVGEFFNRMFGIQTPDKGGESVAETVVRTISKTAVGRFLSQEKA